MKPTADIVEELRLYNRWRRGDEAITAPDPTALGKLLDDAADRIEHLFASGIHTCHADCQRPMCVLRRERDKALAELERVTAERDAKAEECREVSAHAAKAMEDRDALRARVAELEADASFHWITEEELRQSRARVAELKDQGRNACELFDHLKTSQKQLNESNRELAQTTAALKLNKQLRERAEQRNTDLEAALREEKRIHPEDFQPGDFRERAIAAARAEGSASPAKHPDAERLDWLEAQPSKYEWAVTLDHGCVFVTRNKTSGRSSIRAAIDQARAAK